MKEHTMKTIVLDHSLSFGFRQGSTIMWTGISQIYHVFLGASLNCSACSLFFPHDNTTEHAFTAETNIRTCLEPFQPPKLVMTSHWLIKKFSQKYYEHMHPHCTIMIGKVYHLAFSLDKLSA